MNRRYQDGIVARAVDDVTRQWGESYFSAAGNRASVSYESPYVDSNGEGPEPGTPRAAVLRQMLRSAENSVEYSPFPVTLLGVAA